MFSEDHLARDPALKGLGDRPASVLMAEQEAGKYEQQLKRVGFEVPKPTAAKNRDLGKRTSSELLAKAYQLGMARFSFRGSKSEASDDDDFDDAQVAPTRHRPGHHLSRVKYTCT